MIRTVKSRYSSVLRRRYPDEIPLDILRQKGLLFENLPQKLLESPSNLRGIFSECGINVINDEIHLMRNRFGIPCGRAMVLTERVSAPNFDFSFADTSKTLRHPDSKKETEDEKLTDSRVYSCTVTKSVQKAIAERLPPGTRTYVCDEHDVKCFVEQCERYLTLSEDLRRLAEPQNLYRIVTVNGMNKTYGRLELSEVIEKSTGVTVAACDIVFRFKNNGEQDSTAWVLCKNEKDSNRILAKLQEVEVPKRYQYGSLMGASFLYSSRSSIFLSDPSIDFLTKKSKYQVFTMGWQSDVDEEELIHLTNTLKFYPKSVKILKMPSQSPEGFEVGAFIECDRMRNTKKLMMRLQMLKNRWKIPKNSIFFGYPKMADVHWESENGAYQDQNPYDDSDLDEPVEY